MAFDRFPFRKLALAAVAALSLAACGDSSTSRMRAYQAIPAKLVAEMQAKGMTRSSPILVRIYKQESELELWKKTASGQFALLKTYPICRWSGQLGPKKTEGDRQVPEGFYTVGQSQMNPNSRYYLSFDVGYPNNFDRQLGRAGGDIMVHGSCSSRGCFAMTDQEMGEIYAVAREALSGGQPAFQIQSLPFRMTPENMTRARKNPNYGFWQNLKEGADNFEITRQPVQVAACGGRYVFNGQGGQSCGVPAGDATVAAAVSAKRQRDNTQIAALASSIPPANIIYEDGGSNPVFAARDADSTAVPGRDRPYNRVSRPTLVALGENGAPASEADAEAARRASYSAAETLLMSEAAVARRPVGPQKPEIVARRQLSVYARLMGGTMPAKPAPKPAPVIEVAQAAPVAASAGGDPSLYTRFLSFVSETPAQPAAAGQPARVPMVTTSLEAPAGTTVVEPAAPVQATPFYKRWLGLGGSEEAQPAPATPLVGAAPAVGPVPLPPSRPRARTASVPPMFLPGTAPASTAAYADAN